MRLLLDTHIVIWWITGDDRLTPATLALLENDESELYLSSVVAIELSIKAAMGKLKVDLSLTPGESIEWLAGRARLIELPIRVVHGLKLEKLPFHHRDPFDRLLIAQAMVEGLSILTTDVKFASYDVSVIV